MLASSPEMLTTPANIIKIISLMVNKIKLSAGVLFFHPACDVQ